MTLWVRYESDVGSAFGTLTEDIISEFDGDLYFNNAPTGTTHNINNVKLLPPSSPQTFIGLWNNFHEAATKYAWPVPDEPLYFLKSLSSILEPDGIIRCPRYYEGRVMFEGELGVVIGRQATRVPESQADQHIFGYTCVNDITAISLIDSDDHFPQWCRAKSFDTFGPFGPVVACDLDASNLRVQTLVNGRVRQDYSISDMIFSPQTLVSRISMDMTLNPGDVISCGTSVGVLPMRPGSTVEVAIDGIGTLRNQYLGTTDSD